jgi:hypothetical protein
MEQGHRRWDHRGRRRRWQSGLRALGHGQGLPDAIGAGTGLGACPPRIGHSDAHNGCDAPARREETAADDDVQPNAIPIARTNMRLLARPFEDLSPQQQRFLAQHFKRGDRVFVATVDLRRDRWFAELSRWNYITPDETFASSSSYAITDLAWQELERVRRDAGWPSGWMR